MKSVLAVIDRLSKEDLESEWNYLDKLLGVVNKEISTAGTRMGGSFWDLMQILRKAVEEHNIYHVLNAAYNLYTSTSLYEEGGKADLGRLMAVFRLIDSKARTLLKQDKIWGPRYREIEAWIAKKGFKQINLVTPDIHWHDAKLTTSVEIDEHHGFVLYYDQYGRVVLNLYVDGDFRAKGMARTFDEALAIAKQKVGLQ